MIVNIENLRHCQEKGIKVVLFCAGRHGIGIYQIFKLCGIHVDFFSDMNPEKWNTEILDQCVCISPNELKKLDNALVFICIWMNRYEEVQHSLLEFGITNIKKLGDVMDDLLINHRDLFEKTIRYAQTDLEPSVLFYQLNPNQTAIQHTWQLPEDIQSRQNKIAVYTAIFGNYDALHEPEFYSEDIDYYLVSDEPPKETSGFIWVNAKKWVPSELTSPVMRNRYVKMHPHVLFPEYRYAVYMDGTITVKNDFHFFVSKKSKIGISPLAHPHVDCLFHEAFYQCQTDRISVDDVCPQMQRYLNEGMPIHFGLPEMRVFGVDLQNPIAGFILDEWWDELQRGAWRDQFSFMYVLWKHGYCIRDIAVFPWFHQLQDFFLLNQHYENNKLIKNSRL